MPRPEDIEKLTSDPGAVCAVAYDMVLDGNEVGGGSLRINDSELQAKCLKHSALLQRRRSIALDS